MRFTCPNLSPNLDGEGRPTPDPRLRFSGPDGRAYWHHCNAPIDFPAPAFGADLPGDGKAPVSQTVLTCPECGHTWEVLDFGRLDGVKRTQKIRLYSSTHKPARKRRVIVAHVARKDGTFFAEVFPAAKEARLALPRLRYTAGVVKESIYLHCN